MMAPDGPVPAWRSRRPWLAAAVFCDGLLPWTTEFLPSGAKLREQLDRFHRNGCDHISRSVAAGRDGPERTMARYGFLLRELASMGSCVQIASEATAIRKAKQEGRLSVSFHFQSATPFAPDLDLVESFHRLGITRAILAYNEGNISDAQIRAVARRGITSVGKHGCLLSQG